MIKQLLTALLLFVGLGATMAQAQGPVFTFYEVDGGIDRAQLKDVMVAVAGLDPAAQVFHSDDMTILQIKIAESVPDAQLRSVINGIGIQLLPGTPDVDAKYGNAPDVPVYIPTGDPQGDHARYVAEVEQWNALNPDNKMPEPIPYADEK